MRAGVMTYDIAIQDNGRVILPAAFRRKMGIEKGDRLVIEVRDGMASLTTARARRRKAQMIAEKYTDKKSPEGVADAYLAAKRSDIEREGAGSGSNVSPKQA